MIIAVCKDEKEKTNIMRNKSKIGRERVFIDNDLSWDERIIRGKVLEKARELRGKGKRIKVGFNKITTEEEEWMWNKREDKWFRKEV